MAKRRVIFSDDDENPSAAVVKKSRTRTINQVDAGVTVPMDGTISELASARRSMRSSKGTGGRLVQMQELERIQTERTARPSKMDLATQDEDMNPMAPRFQGVDREDSHNLRGKFTAASASPASQPTGPSQPVFSRAAPGEQFGFRLPDPPPQTRAPPRKRFVAPNSETSSRTSALPASLFSGRSLSGTSATSASRATSVCSYTGKRTYSEVVQQRALPPQSAARSHSFAASQPSASFSTRHQVSKPFPDTIHPSLRFEDSDAEADVPPGRSIARNGHSISAAPRVDDNDDEENTPQIDEASPSEDERSAERFLHETNGKQEYDADDIHARASDSQDSSHDLHVANSRLHEQRPPTVREPSGSRASSFGNSSTFVNQAEDVVAAHRERNHAPRLPTNSQLLATHRRQGSSHTDKSRRSYSQEVTAPRHSARGRTAPPPSALSSSVVPSSTAPPSAPQVSMDISPTPQSIALIPPVGPATEGSDPWQLQYYDPATRDVIERAKQFSHCDAASINGFPLRPHFKVKVVEYIDEAIAERRSRGLLVSDGWWPQHSPGITRLLWEDLGNWRSALRKKARTWVAQRYQWDPENRAERNADIAKELLGGGGLFLRDGFDDEGHVNNLAHPALSALILDFFYTGSMSVGKLFPEVFEAAVPRTMVALAATALKVVLDGIVSGQSAEVNFKVNIYSPVYTEILGLMDKCDSSVIHGAKTKDLREKWARQGSIGASNMDPGMVASSGFDVDLD